jgi:hypothetical protein
MARGKKTDNETIYKVMLSYVSTNNFSETARILNMPISTIENIVKENQDKEEFVKLWNEKKEQFVTKANRLIDKAIIRLEEQLDDDSTKIPANNLTTVIGTLYDKRALAKGESTSNENITIRVELTDD